MSALLLAYSLLMLLAGISRDKRFYYGVAVALLMLLLVGPFSWHFVAIALGYVALSAWMQQQRGPAWLIWPQRLLWFVVSFGLFSHHFPGYHGLALAQQWVVKPGSVPVNLYLNVDKVLVAWSLLGWCPLFRPHFIRPWPLSAYWAALLVPVGIGLLMWLAIALGLVAWQPGLTPWLPLLAVSNLLNTCVAEELLFRGILLPWLHDKSGPVAALLLSSLLFGVAHLAGGGLYVLLASLAGVLYGLMVQLTGRLAPAVFCHWALNMTQLLLLTWPMSR